MSKKFQKKSLHKRRQNQVYFKKRKKKNNNKAKIIQILFSFR